MLALFFTYFCISSNVNIGSAKIEEVVLKSQSALKGYALLIEGKPVNQFAGIPFAEPPTGDRRFRRPQAKKPWKKTLSCFEFKPACAQRREATDFLTVPVAENCLFLNVWAPAEAPNLLPVMVFIHGGSFKHGSASQGLYNASTFAARQQVVVVTINYRLGALGFLHVEGTDIIGNQGLYDQLVALKWIKENIASFGGDSGKVTIFGQDAGAASVGFHITSPLCKGLFSRAILQSGVSNCPWALMSNNDATERAKLLANELDCEWESNQELADCLKSADVLGILETNVKVPGAYDFVTFGPIIDGGLIIDDPIKLLEIGKFNEVKLMIGHTINEGYLYIDKHWPDFAKFSEGYRNPDFMNNDETFKLGIMGNLPPGVHHDTIAERVLLYEYSRWNDPVTPNVRRDWLDKMVADHTLVCPILNFANIISTHIDIYFYRFFGVSRTLYPQFEWMGSLHGSDLEYIFGLPFRQAARYREEERRLSEDVMKAFATFARRGNPTPTDNSWQRYDEELQFFMMFGPHDFGPRQWVNPRRCQFWSDYLPFIKDLENQHGKVIKGDQNGRCSRSDAEEHEDKNEL